MNRKINYLHLAALILTITITQPIYAETQEPVNIFTGSEFLTWDQANQELYLRTSFGIAAFVVNQYSPDQGKCLNDWFANNEQAAYTRFIDTMKRFPEYHPRGTIIAVMEKQCGKFSKS